MRYYRHADMLKANNRVIDLQGPNLPLAYSIFAVYIKIMYFHCTTVETQYFTVFFIFKTEHNYSTLL